MPYPRVEIMQGNTIVIPFVLRLKGQKNGWDVSLATSITLEYELNGIAGTPIVANSAFTGADWVNGKVPVIVGPIITSTVGTFSCVLTVVLGAQTITLPADTPFQIEINSRPGYVFTP